MTHMHVHTMTVERLREVLHYDHLSGVFTWVLPRNKVTVGAVAGSINKEKGYRFICIDLVRHQAANLAWLYMTGKWPEALVDHKDKDRSNNKWGNLREVSYSVNAQNKTLNRISKAGHRGVYSYGSEGKFRVSISQGKKNRHVGVFDSLEAAIVARKEAEDKFYDLPETVK